MGRNTSRIPASLQLLQLQQLLLPLLKPRRKRRKRNLNLRMTTWALASLTRPFTGSLAVRRAACLPGWSLDSYGAHLHFGPTGTDFILVIKTQKKKKKKKKKYSALKPLL